MALDKDVLALARYNAEKVFFDRDMTDLLNQYGTLNNVRLAALTVDSDIIIKHIVANGEVVVPTVTGLASATGGAVTGSSATWKLK